MELIGAVQDRLQHDMCFDIDRRELLPSKTMQAVALGLHYQSGG